MCCQYGLYINLTHQFPHREAISSLLDFFAVLLDHLCYLQPRGQQGTVPIVWQSLNLHMSYVNAVGQ